MEKLGKYCKIISGYAFKSNDLSEGTEIPVVKIGNISNGNDIITDSSTQYVSSDFLSIDEKYHIKKGDVLISLTGSHINQPNSMVGRSCRNFSDTEFLLNQRAGKVIPNENADKNYLYYLLNTESFKYSICNRAYGAANQANVSPSDIENIKWDFPPLPTQQKIASILSTYDNLIQNYKKQIEALQTGTCELYKEWFVRFRFPGYQTAEFENGIPKGWSICRLKDFGKVITGKTPPTEKEEYYGGDVMFVKTPDMHGNMFVQSTSEYLSKLGCEYQKAQYLPENSIMVSCIGTGGITAINAYPANTNQQINSIILEDKKYLPWLYFTVSNMKETIEMFGNTGTTMTNLSKGKFEKLKVVKPEYSIIQTFENKVSSLFEQIKNLNKQITNLTQQRDLLLPRLMSGKLEI